MWQGPGQDPGGDMDTGPPPGPSQELSDLKDQFEQQQVLIAQLKEMIRKNEQSNVTQEKVEEYMNTLSKRGGRAKKLKHDDSKKTVDIPASQKISLLRQQVEENKARLAERGKSQKGIEEMVTQLKAQLDDSQQMISQSPLNLSLQDPKVEYSENSTAQELYMALMTKEKRISDLLGKVQKLESNVLDLQENLKEKDSVIDARTKAITLMTENLSRKGKNTLDQLDETKEQMRKMQENFVALEADMKARQMKLLDDLRQKNYEIAELQEINGNLQKQVTEEGKQSKEEEKSNEELENLQVENSKLLKTIAQHEVKIKEQEANIVELKASKSEEVENEEVSKLKKQLEESNKNMIKVKAQHKSKIKELNKKIEAFKKVSDANAEIVKLEVENSRLNQKIVELEEEKGTLQLKLVESDSPKGSEATEQKDELEAQIQDYVKQLEEKDKIISILEAEISRSKTEIETLGEQISGLSHLENAQVTSEMASIHYEEQMESLEKTNKQLTIDIQQISQEKENLLETIEQLKKEKQEISTKLDHYIQENMELIDKLEKLSAEKVSSAESIEIVEGLTQQEKLELEAYQKNMDMVAGKLKSSEENLPQADLNESVNELTEETSELLQKIELFTVERREVMEKMEQLKQENLSLGLKIKEIENNRDVLVETYEQLQSEKEALDVRLETVEAENASLKEKIETKEDQDVVREESSRVKQLEEEIATNKSLFKEKLTELEDLNRFVTDLQSQLEERSKENNQLNNSIIDLNRTLSDLENDNKSLEMKISQLEEQKINLSQLIDKNQEEIEAISNTDWENRRLLESKENEITKLMKERDNTESVIQDLQKMIKDKDENFQKMTSEFKNKYLALQKQLEDNSGNLINITAPLEGKIEELNTKNKDQLEKMKKIAANLKKKTQAYQELEDKFKEIQERHEVELQASLQQLHDLEGEVSRLRQQFDDKCEESRVLQENNVELQNVIADLKTKADRSNEQNLQQELLLTKENLGSVESSLRTKIQELEMIVETQESELTKTRDRVHKLEEGISFVEERRLSLERKANELGAQLEEKALTCEEMSRSEDLLEKRLAALTAHDEAIEKRLEDAVSENQELSRQNKKLEEKNGKLKKKLEEFREKIRSMEGEVKVVEELENQNENLKKQVHTLENDLKNLQGEYERMVEESRNDFDKVSGDWHAQFEEILREKSELMVKCEKFAEELKEISEKEIGFNNELIEYKTKLENSEMEIRNYEEQIKILSRERLELDQLKEIAVEKEEMQKTYEAQAKENEEKLIQTVSEKECAVRSLEEKIEALSKCNEERLEQVITEKENLLRGFQERIEVLSKQNEELIRLKMEREQEFENYRKQTNSNNLASFFDSVPREDPAVAKLQEEVSSSRAKIAELEKTIYDLQSQRVESTSQSQIFESGFQLEKVEAAPQSQIPTFVWSSQSNDTFDFIQPTQATTQETLPPQENKQQELFDKIKTLEFMLFNVEKEKEDALSQCQQLTTELTRLIYERQTQPPTELESQILQESDIRDTPETRQELQKIEFEDTDPPVVSSLEAGPVVEEMIQPKQAYLCYADENQPQIEVDTPESRRQLQQLEETRPSSSNEPNRNTFGENDDGWGWGPEEAKLEEEHAQKENLEELRNRVRVLEMERENHLEEIRQLQVKSGKLIKKLKEFKAKNEELSQNKKSENDFFNLDDTIQEELKLQIQQVEKKLKETCSELEKEKSEKVGLLKRVDILTSANERMVELKEKQDIELLGWQQSCRDLNAKLERLEWGDDGFSAEHVSPEKSTSSGTNENVDVLNKKIEELNETVKDLTLDNEELQVLLEEQRKLRMEAEKSTIQIDRDVFEEEKKQLETEKESLNAQLQLSGEEKKQLQEEVNELIKKNTDLEEKFEEIEKKSRELEDLQMRKEEIIADLNQKLIQKEEEKNSFGTKLQEVEAIQINKDEVVAELNQKLIQKEEERIILIAKLEEKDRETETLRGSMDAQVSVVEERKRLLEELHLKDSEIESLRFTVNSKLAVEEERDQLQKQLQMKDAEIDSLKNSVNSQSSVESEKEVLFKELQEKNVLINSLRESMDTQISSLKQELETQIKTAQTLLDEKNSLVETVSLKDAEIAKLSATMEQMTQEWTMRIDQRGSDVAESWKLHLEAREGEFAQIEQLLRKEIYELEEKTNALVNENNELRKNVDTEIRNEVDRVAALQQQINDRQQYINELTRSLQEKTAEVEVLQGEIQTVKKYLDAEKDIVDALHNVVKGSGTERTKDSLINVFSEKENVIEALKKELEEVKSNLACLVSDQSRNAQEVQNFNALLEERNQTIATLNVQLREMQNLKDYEHENIQNLQQNLLEYQQINSNISSQLQAKTAQLDERDREIANLQKVLEEREREHTYALENLSHEYRSSINDQSQEIETLKRRLTDNENHYEELLKNKETDLEGVRLELRNQSELFTSKNKNTEDLASQLQTKLEECAILQKKIDEQTVLIDEESKQLTELRAIIEEQVLKIEELKTELYQKSNDYDSLIAEVDISRTNIKEDAAKPKVKEENEDLSEPVSRAELDLALYMLHQRDVRCEELTVELTQLLEERDTLQLRLSNVIREKEELGRLIKGDDEKAGPSGMKTEEAVEALDPLTTKLSELKTVGYKKDKRLVDEQELRRLQELSIMQQHRDAASKLPPEAAARLVGASYTLSRDVQSPSKVLLNWLWGRSTPKVNNI